jgi:radical SAM superfamily enzyme YgiQ (UPF0313 family)
LKLALISPKDTTFTANPEFASIFSNSVNLSRWKNVFTGFSPGLLVVAGLTPASWDIDLIDENIEDLDFTKNYDLIGVTAFTQQADRAYEIAREFKTRNITTVIGGIHASVLPDEAKKHFDTVVVGEAEPLWSTVLEDFSRNCLKPFYRSNEQVDLSVSPFPRYDLLAENDYETLWIQTTRGCPHDCEFCAATNIFGKKFRHKSIKQILDEINFVKKNFKHVRIAFADDNLFADRPFARRLLAELTPQNIRYHAQSDISIADDEQLLDLIAKSGCAFLLIGFESVIEESLKGIDRADWKFTHAKNYSAAIRKIQSRGIGVQGAFIVGLDNDTKEVFTKLTDFAVENNLFETQVTICTPLPGTRLRSRLEQEGRLLPTPWSRHNFTQVNFLPKNMTTQELEEGFLNIYKSIDSRNGYYRKMEYFKKIKRELYKKAP